MTLQRDAAAAVNKAAYLQFAWSHPGFLALCEDVGLDPDAAYFPIRVAPMGAVSPEVGAAVMPFFPRALVMKILARAWETVPANDLTRLVVDRYTAMADEVFGGVPHLDELVDLMETAVSACALDGRALTAGWASLEWETPAARLFGAGTVLREYRGEGHLMALAGAGVSGDEAHVLSRLMRGATREKIGHAYRPDHVAELIAALEVRGWVAEDVVTDAGREVHEAVETMTDTLDAAPWLAIGADGTQRLIDLAKAIPSVTDF